MRHSAIGLCAFALLIVSPLYAGAVEAAPPPPPPARNLAPQNELAAVAAKWKVETLAERTAKPGATGQVDVFWELLELLQKDPAARQDPHLEALLAWLLLDAELTTDAAVMEGACTKLGKCLPQLATRVVLKRLKGWLEASGGAPANGVIWRGAAMAGGNFDNPAPWHWPEFGAIDKDVRLAAARELREKGPRHNPVAGVWLAALDVAAGTPDALKLLAAARANLKEQVPAQAEALERQVVQDLAGSGIRDALVPLSEMAETESNGPNALNAPATMSLHQLLSMQPGMTAVRNLYGVREGKSDIDRLKKWLPEHLADLNWDAARHCYTYDVAPPGTENYFAAAKAVEKNYGVKVLERMARGYSDPALALELATCLNRGAAAAKDPDLAQLFLAMLDPETPHSDIFQFARTVMPLVAAANAPLAQTLWVQALRGALADSTLNNLDMLLQAGEQGALIPDEAFNTLRPEYEKSFAAAQQAGDANAALTAAMQTILTGGKIDRKTIAGLLAKAPATWRTGPENQLNRWMQRMQNAGLKGYLRLLLISADSEVGLSGVRGRQANPLGQFMFACQWKEYQENIKTTPAELERCETWLNKYESKLKYDWEKRRFTGAPAPDREGLAEALAQVPAAYKLSLDGALAPGNAGSRQALTALMDLLDHNADAARDPAVFNAVVALLEPAQLQAHDALQNLLYSHRVLGPFLWARRLETSLDAAAPDKFSPALFNFSQNGRPADPAGMAAARAKLLPALTKNLAAAKPEQAHDYLWRALGVLFCDGPVDLAALEKVIPNAGNNGQDAVEGAEALARGGCRAGLDVLLSCMRAAARPEVRQSAAQKFAFLSGRDQFPVDADMDKHVLECAAWLKTYGAALTFNSPAHRFNAPPEARGFNQPALPARPVPRPVRPAPVNPDGNDF